MSRHQQRIYLRTGGEADINTQHTVGLQNKPGEDPHWHTTASLQSWWEGSLLELNTQNVLSARLGQGSPPLHFLCPLFKSFLLRSSPFPCSFLLHLSLSRLHVLAHAGADPLNSSKGFGKANFNPFHV